MWSESLAATSPQGSRRSTECYKGERAGADGNVTKPTENSHGNGLREREVQQCQNQPASSDAIRGLAAFFTDDFMCTTAPTELLSCSCFFFWQFRVQTVATAMNATVGVDTTPTCTRAYAHYSRAHFTRDDCTCGSRLISVAHFSKTLSSLCHVLVWCACHCSLLRHSASSTPLARTRSNPCTSAHWSGMSGCLANPTPHTASRRNW